MILAAGRSSDRYDPDTNQLLPFLTVSCRIGGRGRFLIHPSLLGRLGAGVWGRCVYTVYLRDRFGQANLGNWPQGEAMLDVCRFLSFRRRRTLAFVRLIGRAYANLNDFMSENSARRMYHAERTARPLSDEGSALYFAAAFSLA